MRKLFFAFLVLLSAQRINAQIIASGGGGGNYNIASYPGNFTGYYDGFSVVFKANHANPGAATMQIGIYAAKNIFNTAGNALAANDIINNQVVTLVFDNANNRFQMISTSGNVAAGASISGTGTPSYLTRWATGSTLGSSVVFEDGTGNVGVGTASPGVKFEVNGKVKSNGINETSDLRYKKNIFTIDNALSRVLSLRGVNYEWRVSEFKEKNFDSSPQIGLIAQEVEKIIPQVVTTDAAGFKSVEYSKLVALLIEAVKEQQAKIESLQSAVSNLQSENQSLRSDKEKEMQTLKADVKSMHDAIDILLSAQSGSASGGKENLSLKTGQK